MSDSADELLQDPDDPEEDYVKKQFGLLMYRLQKLPPRSRAKLQSDFTQKMIDSTLSVGTPKGTLSFVLLGKTSAGRAMTVLTKQPATIAWIDSFEPGSIFWDIGASVGVFSVYAALATDTRVVAFEPAAVNYYLLSANCEANKLQDRVDCLLVGVGRQRSIAKLEVSQGRRRPVLRDATIGFVGGASVGAIIGALSYKQPDIIVGNRSDAMWLGAFLGGVPGLLIGGIVGLVPRDRWQRVNVDGNVVRFNMRALPRSGTGIGLALAF